MSMISVLFILVSLVLVIATDRSDS